MKAPLLALAATIWVLAACGGSSGGGGGGDTATADADAATVPDGNCGFTEPTELSDDYDGPEDGDMLTYRLTIEACLPGQIEGIRREEVLSLQGDVLCTSTSRFWARSTFGGDWCEDCTALTGANFEPPVQTGAYCAEAGISNAVPTDFDGNAFETLAIRNEGSHSNDVLYLSQAETWVSMVPAPTGPDTTVSRFFTSFDDTSRATVIYEDEGVVYEE